MLNNIAIDAAFRFKPITIACGNGAKDRSMWILLDDTFCPRSTKLIRPVSHGQQFYLPFDVDIKVQFLDQVRRRTFPISIKLCLDFHVETIMLGGMRITDRAVDEFIAIYREEFGEEISRKDASKIAFEVVTLYEALARRLPNDADPAVSDDLPHQPIGFRT